MYKYAGMVVLTCRSKENSSGTREGECVLFENMRGNIRLVLHASHNFR